VKIESSNQYASFLLNLRGLTQAKGTLSLKWVHLA